MSDMQPARARTAIIIAGVHRSGTSALTELPNAPGTVPLRHGAAWLNIHAGAH